MTDSTRRTILKGALASSAAIFGIGGAAAAFPQLVGAQEDNPGRGGGRGRGDDDTRGGGPATQNECTPPNELLAKFEWIEDTGEFDFEKPTGNDDLVEIYDVQLDGDGEPTGFCWTSEVPVCGVSVKYGQEITVIPGDVYSGCVDLSGARFAISNVIFCVRPAHAVLCDVAMDGFGARTTLDGDPDDGGRTGVVHVSSDGPTDDYASGTVNVAFGQPGLSVGDFDDAGSVLDSLLYDYFEGAGNSNATPDEVFVILQTPAQRVPATWGNDAADTFDVAYRVANQATPTDAWLSRDVDNELNGTLPADNVAVRGWKVNTITSGDIMTASGIIGVAGALRGSAVDFDDLVANYDPDTRVLGVGYGFGYVTETPTLDAYFDELAVGGTTYDFPAALPLTVTDASQGVNGASVTMELSGTEEGVSAADVVPSSVRLDGLLQVAPIPPSQPGGTIASNVTTSGDTITATFDAALPSEFLVSGDFDVDRDQIVSFVAEGEVGP